MSASLSQAGQFRLILGMKKEGSRTKLSLCLVTSK